MTDHICSLLLLVKLPAPVASGSQNVHAKWGGPHVANKKKKSLITGNRVNEISKNGMSVCNRTFFPNGQQKKLTPNISATANVVKISYEFRS